MPWGALYRVLLWVEYHRLCASGELLIIVRRARPFPICGSSCQIYILAAISHAREWLKHVIICGSLFLLSSKTEIGKITIRHISSFRRWMELWKESTNRVDAITNSENSVWKKISRRVVACAHRCVNGELEIYSLIINWERLKLTSWNTSEQPHLSYFSWKFILSVVVHMLKFLKKIRKIEIIKIPIKISVKTN